MALRPVVAARRNCLPMTFNHSSRLSPLQAPLRS
jgi:hypothetical protein